MGNVDRLLAFGFPNLDMRAHAYTVDGDTLTPLPGFRAYAHPAGIWGTRDPSVNRVGGRYVMASTRALLANYLGPNDSLSIAAGDTLVSFRHVYDLPSGVPGTTRCWAPEWLVDNDDRVYLYYAVSTEANPWDDAVIGFNIYCRQMNPYTLQPLSQPVKMEGLTGGITQRVIDAQVTRIDNRYCMVVKDEQRMQIMRAWADTPLGPWTIDRWGNWLNIEGLVEGPELVRLNDRWALFFDRYGADQLSKKESFNLDEWTPDTPLKHNVRDLRHLGLLSLTAGEWVAFRSLQRRVTVWSAGAQSALDAKVKVLSFAGSVDDAHMWYPDRPTALIADEAGTYSLNVEVVWKAAAAGSRWLVYRVNGGPWRWFASQPVNTSGGGPEQAPTVGGISLASGAVVEVGAYQNSGASLDIISAAATLTRARGF